VDSVCQVGAEDVKRLKSLEASLAAAEKELEKVQAGASGLQARAQKVQEQIDNVGGEPLKKRKAKVASLQEVIPYPLLYFLISLHARLSISEHSTSVCV
jgi:peptidoglycan hydrolase CwlO-like protein